MKDHLFRYILRLAGTLLLITGITAALLAGVNAVTAPRIAAAKEEKTLEAVSAVLPDAESAKPAEHFEDATGTVRAVYVSDTGYAVQCEPAGFNGKISMMVGIDREGRVLGISIISHSESPNLGAVAADKTEKGQQFRQQFAGKTGPLAVTKDGGSIDALTSATITSRAVAAGVNAALECVGRFG